MDITKACGYYTRMIKEFLNRISFDESGCWLWKGWKYNFGYGGFSFKGKNILAHRASYTIFNGPIPEGLFVCHHCDVRACVRPDHLFSGTAKDNCHDMMKKGRNMHKVCPWTLARGDRNGTRTKPQNFRKGEKVEWHKLTDADIVEIRRLYHEVGLSGPKIAQRYNVIYQTIYKIVLGYIWKHIPDPYKVREKREARKKALKEFEKAH